jgi:hypothetical protein
MDALFEVLQAVRLTGGMFLDARFTAPWCVSARIRPSDCRPFLAEPIQMIGYHYVVEGRMMVAIDGETPVELHAGEAVLLPRNDPHVLGSTIGLRPVVGGDLIRPAQGGGLAQIVHGGGGAPTRIVCGFLGSDQHRNPLIATLPRILTIDMAAAGSGEWMESSLRFVLRGLREGVPGASPVVSRLSELMFVEAVRRYVETLPEGRRGWLAGMRDPVVGRALALIHGRMDHRGAGRRGGAVALGLRRPLHGACRHAAAALPDRVAHGDREGSAPRRPRVDRADRLRGRLRGRGGVQSRVQARDRHAAGRLAQAGARRQGQAACGGGAASPGASSRGIATASGRRPGLRRLSRARRRSCCDGLVAAIRSSMAVERGSGSAVASARQASARSSTRTTCTATRPAPSWIWWRHEVPSATMIASSPALRTAGSRLASAILSETSRCSAS